MRYTEKDIREAFQAGMNKGSHQSYFDAPLDENEYIKHLKQSEDVVLDSVSVSDFSDCALQGELEGRGYVVLKDGEHFE